MSGNARVTLDEIVRWFETLSPQNVGDTPKYYAPDASFKDPFNEVSGAARIERIYRHMFEQVDEPRFAVTGRYLRDDGAVMLTSELACVQKGGSKRYLIRCATLLEFDVLGRIVLHRDYWDPAEELYEHVPLLGCLMRFIRRRLEVAQD